jgi:hypothetical protein
MNFKLPVPKDPLEALATAHTNAESSPTETSKVITSRHLTTNESAIGIESPWADHLSRGNKK